VAVLKSIDLVEIRVKDWKAAVEWYQNKLDLQVAAWDPDDEYCQLEPVGGGCRLGLFGVAATELGSRSRCLPTFQVDDLAGTLQALQERGVAVDRDVTGGDEGFRSADIVDCEGNLIQLYEWYSG
jgi:predicted enzyme related to lactoylglutathione lyase